MNRLVLALFKLNSTPCLEASVMDIKWWPIALMPLCRQMACRSKTAGRSVDLMSLWHRTSYGDFGNRLPEPCGCVHGHSEYANIWRTTRGRCCTMHLMQGLGMALIIVYRFIGGLGLGWWKCKPVDLCPGEVGCLKSGCLRQGTKENQMMNINNMS